MVFKSSAKLPGINKHTKNLLCMHTNFKNLLLANGK